MTLKEWYINFYIPTVARAVALEEFDDLDPKTLLVLARLAEPWINDNWTRDGVTITTSNLDSILEKVSWDEQDLVYKKLNKMGHRIY